MGYVRLPCILQQKHFGGNTDYMLCFFLPLLQQRQQVEPESCLITVFSGNNVLYLHPDSIYPAVCAIDLSSADNHNHSLGALLTASLIPTCNFIINWSYVESHCKYAIEGEEILFSFKEKLVFTPGQSTCNMKCNVFDFITAAWLLQYIGYITFWGGYNKLINTKACIRPCVHKRKRLWPCDQ